MTRITSRRARRWRGRLGVLLLLFAVCAASFAAVYLPAAALAVEHDEGAAGGYDVPWWTADSGGGSSSSSGYSLRGTIGQPDAAVSAAAGSYTLHGGFWRTAPLQPLTLQPLADQTAQTGSNVSLQVVVNNPAGGALTYSAAGLPPGLLIDPATGMISGTLAGPAGVHIVTVTVTNDRGESAQTTFTFTVTAPTDLEPDTEPNLLPSLYLPLVAN